MKIITASNGRRKIKISKSEWHSIGKKAGWTKKAGQVATIVMGLQKGIVNPSEMAQLVSLLNSISKMGLNAEPIDLEAVMTLANTNEDQATDPNLIEAIGIAKNIASYLGL